MGTVIHTSDAPVFAAYLRSHYHRRPPDHLLVEWFAGETDEAAEYVGKRAHVTFRYNLMEHRGRVSTLRAALAKPMPTCYEQLVYPVLFRVRRRRVRPAHVWSDPAAVALSLSATRSACGVCQVEEFDVERCSHDDITPCPDGSSAVDWLALYGKPVRGKYV
jgi:hypothetical protein